MYFIYVIENRVNGKMYVGQTRNPRARRHQHFSAKSGCPYVKNAIRKYGKGNLNFRIIEECGTLEIANAQEKFWIKSLNTLRPFGYNLRVGGEAGGFPSQETREKMRLSQLGKKQSRETIEKRAAAHRGRKNSPETIERMRRAANNRSPEKCSMFGKKHSAITKQKMSLSQMKTHCKRGHPLDGPGSDVWISKDGNRNCRACRRFLRSGTLWNPSNL
jgi:group I intron endonuclease